MEEGQEKMFALATNFLPKGNISRALTTFLLRDKIFQYAVAGHRNRKSRQIEGRTYMDKKYRTISGVFAACGMIGAILMIAACFMADAFPRPLWIVAAICMLMNVSGILMNYRYVRKQQAVAAKEKQ